MSVALAKWTLDDYHRMTAAGILDDRPVELLNGEIVTLAPEGPEHAFLGDEDGDYLSNLLGQRAKVRQGRPITLPNQSESEPDLAIVKPLGDTYRHRHPYAEDVFWVIELSHTSLTKDLETKPPIYAAAGIPEYWVVNLKDRAVVVFREPAQGQYQSQQTLSSGDIQPVAFPDLTVSMAQLLQQG
ncbi:MAG: Uma2 family endonuclease [Cyanobacteria bacterium]|nr:Uma2 family endonuclease [Cyanobacteriota bacterium]MDA0865194.1 Uma2 family endonuclease [Cyanobacteriota bacterium]